jgi:hypothetical protein
MPKILTLFDAISGTETEQSRDVDLFLWRGNSCPLNLYPVEPLQLIIVVQTTKTRATRVKEEVIHPRHTHTHSPRK